MRRWLLVALVAAAAAGAPAVASADPTPADKAAAESLFEDGRKLSAAGDYDQAIGKLEASQRLDPGVGTLLYLADAYEKAGRTASAWVTFREAAAEAKRTGQPDREAKARQRGDQLEPKLSKLTIKVGAGADTPGLEVRRNGAVVKPDLLGAAVAVDPGVYVVEASAAGRKGWSTRVEIGRDPGPREVTIPALEAAAPAPTGAATSAIAPPSTPAGDRDGGRRAAPDRDAPTSGGSAQRTVGLVVAGAGVVGLAVTGVLVAMAVSKDGQADDHCDATTCRDAEGVQLSKDAKSLADVSGITFALGGAALIGGAVLYFTAPKPASRRAESASRASSSALRPARGLAVVPAVSPTGGGVWLRGAL